MHIGSTDKWNDLIDSQVPEILDLIIESWNAMPSPAGDEREDRVSELLCHILRQSRNRCELPFRIDTQLVELDPEAGEDQGRMDIVFSPMVPRENIYFCLECKRLNVRSDTPPLIRPLFSEYVRFGMLRFIRGQYGKEVKHGGMLGFVLDGNLPHAMNGVESNIQRRSKELQMFDKTGSFSDSSILPANSSVRETKHRRRSNTCPFLIHHIFVAADPTTPLLATLTPIAPSKPKKTRSRRKSAS